jgi:putative flippase GtrA
MITDLLRGPEPSDCHNSWSRTQPRTRPTLVRWGKFNLVGAMGIGVQLAALFLLKTAMHFQYLVATAIAVEAAVLHNFIWHERFTWADRICAGRSQRKTKQSPHSGGTSVGWNRLGRSPGCCRRLGRFHLANGAVSILGNLAMMKILVGSAPINYLMANAIAIAVCSLANFVLSDQWVFETRGLRS